MWVAPTALGGTNRTAVTRWVAPTEFRPKGLAVCLAQAEGLG